MLSRRTLLKCGLLAPAFLSRQAMAQVGEFHPLLPTTGENTHYARLAEAGPYGTPDHPYIVEPFSELKLYAFLPKNIDGPLRTVVFSHGEISSPTIYAPLLGHWASHGFAVLAPVHHDSFEFNKASATNLGAAANVENDVSAWHDRVAGCQATLNAIPYIAQSTNCQLLTERPIIAGHSFGAFIAQLLLGTRVISGKSILSLPDKRFFGGMLLSPQGRGVMGLANGSWDSVSSPMLAVTGNGDTDVFNQPPETKADPYFLSKPNYKHLAWFNQILPVIFTGQEISPDNPRMPVWQDLLAVTTAFLYAYSNYQQDYLTELATSYYDEQTHHRIKMSYR